MHAQHETARCLLGRRADYVISAIKDNQETILEDLKAIDFSDAPWHETGQDGRIERRRCAAGPLRRRMNANLHGRRQAMRNPQDRQEQHRSEVLKESHAMAKKIDMLLVYPRPTATMPPARRMPSTRS